MVKEGSEKTVTACIIVFYIETWVGDPYLVAKVL